MHSTVDQVTICGSVMFDHYMLIVRRGRRDSRERQRDAERERKRKGYGQVDKQTS